MNESEKHFKESKTLAESLNLVSLGEWLLNEGYYPETYVLPPQYTATGNTLRPKSFYIINTENKIENVVDDELFKICIPKSNLADRFFGVIQPRLHHDMVWTIVNNWENICEILFSDRKIYSFSFPIPLDKTVPGMINKLRTGRMIYEYIEMAENALLVDGVNYKYILHVDIKNFYPSIYTHSISWAVHGKSFIRDIDSFGKKRRNNYTLYGNVLDKLFQAANDSCTNGIPIGPVISDLIAEIICCSIDKTIKLPSDCFGARFKDDYRILCNTKEEAEAIIKELQSAYHVYNLSIHEEKTKVCEFPEGLYRPWIIEANSFIDFKDKKSILTFNKFEKHYHKIIEINDKYPDKGIIDKFLAYLYDYDNKVIRLDFLNIFEEKKFISLIFILCEKRYKVVPQVFALLQLIYTTTTSDDIRKFVAKLIEDKKDKGNDFLKKWLNYFKASTTLSEPLADKDIFNSVTDFSIFDPNTLDHETILEYTRIFKE